MVNRGGVSQKKVLGERCVFFVYQDTIFRFSVLFALVSSLWPFLKTTILLGLHEIHSSFPSNTR